MKRILLVVALLLVMSVGATLGANTFVVGIEESTKGSWQTLGSQFQSSTGITISIQPL